MRKCNACENFDEQHSTCRITTITVGPEALCNCGKFRSRIPLFERITKTPHDLAEAVVYFDGWSWRSVLLPHERFKERSKAVGATVILLEG